MPAGREIAIPYEVCDGEKDLLTQPGTVFRREHPQDLAFLRGQLDFVRRMPMPFPARGIITLDQTGRVAAAYPSYLNSLVKR